MSQSKKHRSLKSQTVKTLGLKKSQQIKKSVNHHDMFFKSFYSDPAFALELFQFIFSKEELNACDWKNLRVEKDSLKEKRADLVFSVPLKAQPKTTIKIFILLEHKSYYDPELFSQLLYYQPLLHEYSLKANGIASPIIPVVLYHGKTPWKWAKTFQETVFKDFLTKIPAQFRKNMIDYKIRLLDANAPKLKRIFKNKKFKSRGALYLLRRIWSIKLSRTDLKEVLALFGDLSGDKQSKLIVNVSDYLRSVLKAGKEFKKLWQTVERELVREGIFKKGGYMDTFQYIEERNRIKGRKEGLRKGRQEGRQEVILNMLKEKLDIALIAKLTNMPMKEIKKLKSKS